MLWRSHSMDNASLSSRAPRFMRLCLLDGKNCVRVPPAATGHQCRAGSDTPALQRLTRYWPALRWWGWISSLTYNSPELFILSYSKILSQGTPGWSVFLCGWRFWISEWMSRDGRINLRSGHLILRYQELQKGRTEGAPWGQRCAWGAVWALVGYFRSPESKKWVLQSVLSDIRWGSITF